MTTWGVAITPNAIYAWFPESAERLNWLSAVSFVLGCIAVTAFIGMLAVAAKWSPSRH